MCVNNESLLSLFHLRNVRKEFVWCFGFYVESCRTNLILVQYNNGISRKFESELEEIPISCNEVSMING